MNKTKRAKKQWPRIYTVQRNGRQVFQVDLRAVNGGRPLFDTRAEADTFADQSRITRGNEGVAFFGLPQAAKMDAVKAHEILSPHNITLLECAKHYAKHVLAYKTSPLIKEIVALYISDREQKIRRPRTIKDLKSRLGMFAKDFGDKRLSELSLDDLNKWLQQFNPRNFINNKTKISQLYNFALKRPVKWVDENITSMIVKPNAPQIKTEIFTVEQAKLILDSANQYELLPYMVLGMFAGMRTEEIRRFDSKDILFDNKIIRIGAEVAKKRFWRYITMQPACLAYLEPLKTQLEKGGQITDKSESWIAQHRTKMLKIIGMSKWPHNGLRHSFGSYHFEMFGSAEETAKQMGNSPRIVHNYYKALVTKAEAEKFWNLRP